MYIYIYIFIYLYIIIIIYIYIYINVYNYTCIKLTQFSFFYLFSRAKQPLKFTSGQALVGKGEPQL